MTPHASRNHTTEYRGRPPRRGRAPWLLVALPALFLAAFFYLPILDVLSRGFRAPDGSFSLAAVAGLLADPYIQRLIRFTALQALASAALSVVIGVPLAYVLARTEFPGRRMLTALTMVPFVLPSITVALGFLLMYGTSGWLNQTLRSLFGVEVRVLHSLWAILLAHAFYNAPVVARITQAAWEQIDPRLEESARTLGAGPLAVFRDVTLPALLPAIAGGAVLAFIYCFMSFPIVLALGGARYSTLEVEIFTQVQVLWDYRTGAALAAIQATLSLAFVYVMLKLQGDPAAFGGRTLQAARRSLVAWRRRFSLGQVAAWLFLAAGALFFVGPIASIAWHSLLGTGGQINLDGYARIFSTRHSAIIGNSPLSSIRNSLYFGAFAGAIALVLGLSFSYGLVRSRLRRKIWLETFALAPLVVSSVALGFGVLIAFRRPFFERISSDWRVILIHAVLAFPFVVRSIRPVLANLDPALHDAARTLGASTARAFRTVELPLIARGVIVALAFAFGISVAEMSATMMLARPGLVTMPVGVYRFLASRDFQAASAMAVVLVLVTAGAFAGIEGLTRLLGGASTAGDRRASDETAGGVVVERHDHGSRDLTARDNQGGGLA